MAFGEEDSVLRAQRPSLSPDSVKDILDHPATPNPVALIVSGMESDAAAQIEGKNAETCEEEEESDGDLTEQSFEEHDAICRQLERTLGLNCLSYNGRDLDDWSELASVIGYHYAAQMDSSWVKSAGKQNISPSALLLCLIYMERLHMTNPDFRYHHLMTSSELFVVSLMSACKFLYDVGEVGDCYNGTWARHCKIPIKRLNKMEVDFLDALEWNLLSDATEFEHVMAKVQTDIVRSNLRFHNSLTYSDLHVLANLSNGFSRQMIQESVLSVVKIFTALTASYILLGVVTLTVAAPLALRLSGTTRSTTAHLTTTTPSISQMPHAAANLPSTTIVTGQSLPTATSHHHVSCLASHNFLCNESVESSPLGTARRILLSRGPHFPHLPSFSERGRYHQRPTPIRSRGSGLPLVWSPTAFNPSIRVA